MLLIPALDTFCRISRFCRPTPPWILNSRLEQLSKEQTRGLAPLCPDLVVELMSPSDRLAKGRLTDWFDEYPGGI